MKLRWRPVLVALHLAVWIVVESGHSGEHLENKHSVWLHPSRARSGSESHHKYLTQAMPEGGANCLSATGYVPLRGLTFTVRSLVLAAMELVHMIDAVYASRDGYRLISIGEI